jgi:hypothetical protein
MYVLRRQFALKGLYPNEKEYFFEKNNLLKFKQNFNLQSILRKLGYFFLDKKIWFC